MKQTIASFARQQTCESEVWYYYYVQYWQPDREKEKLVASLSEIVQR
jgi:hypothetical protein